MNRELLLACLTFVAGVCVGWLVAYPKVRKARIDTAMLYQVSGELCDKCGWAMKFPDEPCRCELLSEVERLRSEEQRSIH